MPSIQYIVLFVYRYNSVVSFRKALLFLLLSWALSVLISAPVAASWPPLRYRREFGGCLPAFTHNVVFPAVYFALGFVTPILIVVGVNLKIVGIAKYHQFRIANALLGMALSAHAISEGAKARDRQKDALMRFQVGISSLGFLIKYLPRILTYLKLTQIFYSRSQGLNGVITLSQLVGTLIVFYYTISAFGLYEAFTGSEVHPAVAKACVVLLMISPVSNGFIFGLKNKVRHTIVTGSCEFQLDSLKNSVC